MNPDIPALDAESAAIKADAERRLGELRRVAAALWPDREDCGEVLSELTSVMSQIRAAEAVLRTTTTTLTQED